MTIGDLQTSGVSSDVDADGRTTVRFARLEMRDLVLRTPLGQLRVGDVEMADVSILLPPAAPETTRVPAVTVGELRVKDASIEPQAIAPRASTGGGTAWRVEPLASLEGTLRAEIVDAAWIFDADVTIPIAAGRIDFNRATVAHVGPDSSMGVSRSGVYVDAPNGRTHLFQWSAANLPGVEFERRGIGLGPFRAADRGAIELRPLLERVLAGTSIGTLASNVRALLERTRVSGEFRLGDGTVGDERRRIVLAGAERGRNHVELSPALRGRGLVVRIPEGWADALRWEALGAVVSTGALSARLSVQLSGAAQGTPTVSVSVSDLGVRDIELRGPSPV